MKRRKMALAILCLVAILAIPVSGNVLPKDSCENGQADCCNNSPGVNGTVFDEDDTEMYD